LDEEEGAELDGMEGEERVEILEGEHRAGGRVADRLRITTRYMTKCVALRTRWHPITIPKTPPASSPRRCWLQVDSLRRLTLQATIPPPPALVVPGTSVRAFWELVRCRSP
jgi:hypothetical protein